MIDMNHKYQTRDGRAVRILATGMRGLFSVAGIITETDDSQHIYSWMEDGKSDIPANVVWNRSSDLIPVPTKHEAWAVIDIDAVSPFPCGINSFFFKTYEQARAYIPLEDQRVAHVTWED